MKIAFVIPRYGPELVGGAETLARQYAASLSRDSAVEVLTTCCLDHVTWANHYPAGVSEAEGIRVRRFASDSPRTDYSWKLYRLLQGTIDLNAFAREPLMRQMHASRVAGWPRALQEEMIRSQGPYSSSLFQYLKEHRLDYDVFVFFSYLFAPIYFGMPLVPAERTVFCPTLHDEPVAYLPMYRKLFHRPRSCIFLSETERLLAKELHGFRGRSEVVGMALTEPSAIGHVPPGTPSNYLLYAGRIEGGKGIDVLIGYFVEYKKAFPSDLKLVLIGQKGYPLPPHPDLIYLGFVSEAEKFALMKSARALVHPSPFESFSIVLLESFLMARPALVNQHCQVLLEHCRNSGAGIGFGSEAEFVQAMERILNEPKCADEMGARGRAYVKKNFQDETIEGKLHDAISGNNEAQGLRPLGQSASKRPDPRGAGRGLAAMT